MTVDGAGRSGRLDSSGAITEWIPPEAREAEIVLTDEAGDEESLDLMLGHLMPLDTVEGVQSRLRNLGYGPDEITGKRDVATIYAISRFQRHNELKVTGEMDDDTRKVLSDAHLC